MDWYEEESRFDENYGILTRKVIRLLSENARASILELSQRLGTSRKTVRDRLQRAETELGIRYTTEFNEAALKLPSPHIIRVKFTNKPSYVDITRILSSSYIPQLAVAMKGTYDLLIYANAVTSGEYVHWDKRTQIQLSKYGVSWHSSDVAHRHLGFFPLRNELLDRVDLDYTHKAMLKALNANSRITFSQMSKDLGMHFNTVGYNFNKLLKEGYIRRFTVSMDMPRGAVGMGTFGRYILSDKYEEDSVRSRLAYRTNGTEYPIASRYLVVSQLVGSDWVFIMGLFDNYNTAYEHMVSMYRKTFAAEKVKVDYAVVDKVILGRLPIRSIDSKKEYEIIKWAVDRSDMLQ